MVKKMNVSYLLLCELPGKGVVHIFGKHPVYLPCLLPTLCLFLFRAMMGQLSAACSHSHFVRLFQKQLLQVRTAVVAKRCGQLNKGWHPGSDRQPS